MRFYRDTLGLKLHRNHGDFVFGDVRLNLGLHDRVVGRSRDPCRVMVHLGVVDIQQEVWNRRHTRR